MSLTYKSCVRHLFYIRNVVTGQVAHDPKRCEVCNRNGGPRFTFEMNEQEILDRAKENPDFIVFYDAIVSIAGEPFLFDTGWLDWPKEVIESYFRIGLGPNDWWLPWHGRRHRSRILNAQRREILSSDYDAMKRHFEILKLPDYEKCILDSLPDHADIG